MVTALAPDTRAFYCGGLTLLRESETPFLVGGAYAYERYTGIARHTKDFDIFVHPEDFERVLGFLEGHGFRTEVTFSHWLGKAYCGEDFVDVIFGSGNGIARVDDLWFEHAVDDVVFGQPVRLIPAEEMIWSKAFIMERERFDGADVAHVLRARAECLDWRRLLMRFGPHWRVLLSHLLLFGFAYPGERGRIPAWVMSDLLRRAEDDVSAVGAAGERICQGTMLSRAQYRVDVDQWGYGDPRLQPRGTLSREQIEQWTAGIDEPEAPPAESPRAA